MQWSRRQILGAGTVGLAVAAGAMSPARAAQPRVGRQVPGVYRIGIAGFEVTALLDGFIDLATNLFPDATDSEIARLQKAHFLPQADMIRSGVNSYAVNTGERLVLIDAGGRDLMGPSLGRLPASLQAAGISPDAIDAVLATHLHPDHIGGLVTADGAAVFPNAELIMSRADWDFWTDAEMMAKTNDQGKVFFQAAQAAITPYAKRTRLIGDDEMVFPGIRSRALPGHTPGHTGFVIGSETDSLFVWGDIVHSAMLQIPHPEWSIAFDIGPDLAVTTRRKALEAASAEGQLIAGMHLPFPGIGHVTRDGSRFGYWPAQWRYEL